jgi:regulator of protease activity HflC (stomatin/prohibitin superfamily)
VFDMKQTATNSRRIIQLAPYERAVVVQHGAFVVATTDRVRSSARRRVVVVDIRPMTYPVQGQEIATSDEVAVRVSLTSTLVVVDPVAYVMGSQSVHADLHFRLQIALRQVVPTLTLEELLAQRANLVLDVADTADLGLSVTNVRVLDITLPPELRRARAQTLVARAEGLAALERARGEAAALRSLANAARMLSEQPSLYDLRLLQQVGSGVNTVVLGNRSPE